jgi:hypothetical protein
MNVIGFMAFIVFCIQLSNLDVNKRYENQHLINVGSKPLYVFIAFVITLSSSICFGPPISPVVVTISSFILMLCARKNLRLID